MSPASTTGTSSGLGKPHIGDVAGAQVDLRRAARAFDDHEVMRRLEPGETLQHRPISRPFKAP
jgi:hypothetical protein